MKMNVPSDTRFQNVYGPVLVFVLRGTLMFSLAEGVFVELPKIFAMQKDDKK